MNIPIRIAGLGFQVPETVITNEDLTKIIDTSDEWIKTRTGIEKRHVLSGNETAVEMGIKAAQKALAKAKTDVEKIDYIIAAASLETHAYPSTACEIQAAIGAKNAACFDITAACSGLIYGMGISQGLIKSGMAKNILIVATDAISRCLDWSDRSTCVLFGDGAGAMMLTVSDDEQDDILSVSLKAEGHLGHFITMPTPGKNCPLAAPNDEQKMFVKMEGKEVYKYVVTKLPVYIEECVAKSGLKMNEIDYLVPHQANMRIIEALEKRLEFNSENVISNIKDYANTSAASIPIALVEAIESGKMKLPCSAILTGFGAGMTVGSAVVKLREGIA
ncbi:MAG: ketoacyl-ACP synthase III [Candidatus Gastranaerophilales bacterium]|nr:ketoacyl-ACP synthase III [Candidatus Gastranaerophilales bacterium]